MTITTEELNAYERLKDSSVAMLEAASALSKANPDELGYQAIHQICAGLAGLFALPQFWELLAPISAAVNVSCRALFGSAEEVEAEEVN